MKYRFNHKPYQSCGEKNEYFKVDIKTFNIGVRQFMELQ
jgi:hypothetical protein